MPHSTFCILLSFAILSNFFQEVGLSGSIALAFSAAIFQGADPDSSTTLDLSESEATPNTLLTSLKRRKGRIKGVRFEWHCRLLVLDLENKRGQVRF